MRYLFCEEHNIIHEVITLYINGIAERKNNTLMDMINAVLVSLGISKNL